MDEKFTKEDIMKLPFMDLNLDLEKRLEDLLGRLTLQEKFDLSSGKKIFFTKSVKRLGVPSFKMSDGPHGIGSGIYFSKKMTYFPTAICRAATWNSDLSEQFGIALAEEVRSVNRHMVLAPGINIDRTPLCGRTFEYQTEDPYLNKKLVVSVVKGIQSQKIAACVKHFACNNQEFNRFRVDVQVSERALREIYLPAFEAAVKEADAWSIMACYNKVNGLYGSENKNLLTERLRDEWGFRGFVVSDWFATRRIKTSEGCVNAGLSLEMPWRMRYKLARMVKAFNAKKFTEETFNENFRRLLRVMFLTGVFDDPKNLPQGNRNTPEHQALVRKIAEEGIVLLKNNDNILPLDPTKIKNIAVLGPNANKKHAFGGGSSMVRAIYEITPLQGIKERCEGKINIIKTASEADIAIFVGGLNHKKKMDCENKDRIRFEVPEDQIASINQTVQENPKTIVILINGSPIGMEEWIDKVPAIVDMWFAGQEGGRALANILFGEINPSGKLPITFPKKLSDSPAHASSKTYPGDVKVFYDEGVFVGYRHFDTKNLEPRFSFGHGLSYTTFKYDNLKLSKDKIAQNDKLTVSVDISNVGNRAGAEVVQLYVQDVDCSVERPLKELKGFYKVMLESGKKQTIKFELDKNDLSFYDEKNSSWKAERGTFNILIGSSSKDIRLQGKVEYIG